MLAHPSPLVTAPAPVGNTGLYPRQVAPTGTSAHLDTLVLCGDGISFSQLADKIDRYLNIQFDLSRDYSTSHGKRYSHNLHGQLGLLLSYNGNDFDDLIDYRISFTGSVCNSVPVKCLIELFRFLQKTGCHATRFDWAIDDFDKRLAIQDFYQLSLRGCYYGARTFDYYESRTKKKEEIGSTIYIGRAGGTQRLCIYDKFVESKGRINAIRMEYRFFEAKADYFFNLFIEDRDKKFVAQKISRYCLGRIGFSKSDDAAGRDFVRLRLWEELVLEIGEKIKTTFPKKPTLLEDKKRWICSSVAPSLAMLASSMSRSKFMGWLKNLISNAIKKLKPSQILDVNFIREWDDMNTFGLDYSSVKKTFDVTSLDDKKNLLQVNSTGIKETCNKFNDKKYSQCRPLSLVEQLSFLIDISNLDPLAWE
jgi:hypothetical protein